METKMGPFFEWKIQTYVSEVYLKKNYVERIPVTLNTTLIIMMSAYSK